jgi:thiol-disulfide isomerase/thioredoxin
MQFLIRTLRRGGALLALLAAFVLVMWAGLPDRAAYTGQYVPEIGYVAPEIGAFAPPFDRQTLTGQRVQLTALRGQPVLLNFWATWCEPCRLEMPLLQTLHEEYPQLRILAINLGEDPVSVAEWVQRLELTFDIVLDPARQLELDYALRGQPSTYVIAPDGRLSAIFYGIAPEPALRAALEANVRQSPTTTPTDGAGDEK